VTREKRIIFRRQTLYVTFVDELHQPIRITRVCLGGDLLDVTEKVSPEELSALRRQLERKRP